MSHAGESVYLAPPSLQMNFSDELTAEQRQVAERSVAEFAARSVEVTARRRAARAARAELSAALQAPLRKIIESDPDAVAALAAARRRQPEREPSLEQLFDLEPPAWPVIARDFPLDLAGVLVGGVADQVFPIPYHYDWRWYAPGVEPAVFSADHTTGQVSIATGTRGGFVDAHAGVGVSLRTDRVTTVSGRSLRSSWDKWSASAGSDGLGVSEGGMEMTVFEDGELRGFIPDNRWSVVASDYQPVFGDTGGFGTGDPVEVSWTMRPGRDYTFNVGAWVRCTVGSSSEGAEFDWATGDINAKVTVMTLFHQ
jgi:hypothetical protein